MFTSLAQWQTFHNAICADLGIPRPGYNQATGKPDLAAQWTTSAHAPRVATVLVNSVQRKIGLLPGIPAAVVTKYGLNVITDPTPILDTNGLPTGQWNVTYLGTQYTVTLVDDPVTFPYAKAKPATWTDPKTGTIYQVPTG